VDIVVVVIDRALCTSFPSYFGFLRLSSLYSHSLPGAGSYAESGQGSSLRITPWDSVRHNMGMVINLYVL
jgi:hypothetical protein